ncbi:MAG: hypothetical protein QNJ31_06675 [Candidatus Caenarcaniphilales bacterium]|nr:hypothetical protein [Candidatus Caenarcaniphilales bacterium]
MTSTNVSSTGLPDSKKVSKKNIGIELKSGTSCVVLGGSSIATLSSNGEVQKNQFYPNSVAEYVKGIVDAGISYGKIEKDKKGVLVIAAPGAFQNEGAIAGLPPNFHRVKEDAVQRGMPNLFFRQLIEEELEKRGYKETKAYGYNDSVPALCATLTQENTEEVLKDFENELGIHNRSEYSINYIINGTGTGEGEIEPDTQKVRTAEKGHLKPDYLWYELNPFFKFIIRFPEIGQNRTIERLVAGGPDRREARHFTKILNAILNILNSSDHPDIQGLSRVLGFKNYEELIRADGENGILKTQFDTEEASSLVQLGQAIKDGSKLAVEFRNVFAKAIGSSLAMMHFAIGEMPDPPLKTFIGPNDIRSSILGFIRSDGSTTALFAGEQNAWKLLEENTKAYAKAMVGDKPHLVRVLDINGTFPNIHPDFGGLPALAANKLTK